MLAEGAVLMGEYVICLWADIDVLSAFYLFEEIGECVTLLIRRGLYGPL
jgi:hypothetical protein